jgi:hypothetical protein
MIFLEQVKINVTVFHEPHDRHPKDITGLYLDGHLLLIEDIVVLLI